jgi:hypothetical protein
MKEEYLHHLWKLKRFQSNEFISTDGNLISIIQFGWHNTASGPDFFNGQILLNGIKWSGNIEMHVKSSDWYLHKHHQDEAYNNVILHVVYEHDKEVWVNQQLVPTIELKNQIDLKHLEQFQSLNLSTNWMACENQINHVDKIVIDQQIDSAIINRLERKSNILTQELKVLKGDLSQLIYEKYANIFGLKVNELPFLELAKKLPFHLIKNKNFVELKTMMLGVAGLLNETNENYNDWKFFQMKYNLSEMNSSSWKKKGLRPHSFPINKIQDFAFFCSFQSNFEINVANEFHALKNQFSNSFIDLLKINALSIFLWWEGKKQNVLKFQENSLILLEKIKAEKNAIIENWKNKGILASNSYESQALIEQKNEFCNKKRCLNCKIGVTILNN